MVEVKVDFAGNLKWLSEFYLNCGYGGKAQSDDQVFYAVDASNSVGVVRLSEENGITVLRGMQVLDAHRNNGVGIGMLEYMTNVMVNRPCYCLPYSHLERFYGSIGFEKIMDENLPSFLLKRKQEYTRRGMDVIAMFRR